MILAGEVFKFGDTRVGVFVGVIDDGGLLENRAVMRLMFELKAPVGKLAETVVEELVHRTGEDQLAMRDEIAHLPIVGVQHDLDVRVIEEIAEHVGETARRHRLIGVGEVAVVAVEAQRDAGGDLRVKLGGIEAPLFAGVAAEEFFVELAAYAVDDHVFGGDERIAFFGDGVEERLHAGRVELAIVERVDRVEIDGDGHETSVHAGAHAMLILTPLGEARQVVENIRRVGVEDMRPVTVDEDAGGIVAIVGVATDVGAFVHDEDALFESAGESFREHAAGEARANNQVIKHTRGAGR